MPRGPVVERCMHRAMSSSPVGPVRACPQWNERHGDCGVRGPSRPGSRNDYSFSFFLFHSSFICLLLRKKSFIWCGRTVCTTACLSVVPDKKMACARESLGAQAVRGTPTSPGPMCSRRRWFRRPACVIDMSIETRAIVLVFFGMSVWIVPQPSPRPFYRTTAPN